MRNRLQRLRSQALLGRNWRQDMRGLLRALRGPLLKRLEKSRDGLCCYFDLDEADRELHSVVWPKLTSFDSANLFPNVPCGQIQLTLPLNTDNDYTRCLDSLRPESEGVCRLYATWDVCGAELVSESWNQMRKWDAESGKSLEVFERNADSAESFAERLESKRWTVVTLKMESRLG